MDNAEKLRPRVLCKCQHDENQHHSQAVRSIGLANHRCLFTAGCGRPVNGSHVASFTDRSWPGRRPTTERLEPRTSCIDVSLRSLAWPHIPRKFTRRSHLASTIAPNRLF
jgi:hypothetical protein